MIQKYSFGEVVETNATVKNIEANNGTIPFGTLSSSTPFSWEYTMSESDIVYGLGESMRGMNKRGFHYQSWCTDASIQNESTQSLYGAHNFLLIFGSKTFGVFFDTSARIAFDIGWTEPEKIFVNGTNSGVDFYVITPDDECDNEAHSELENIVFQFRTLIGQSYIPPRWAFGFQQSRWGYKNEADIRHVVKEFKEAKMPIDSICMDIDYMDEYKDFTVDEKKFPNVQSFVKELDNEGIHLIPIIDAGVKIKKGYDVYEDGIKKSFFCNDKNDKPFTAGVWPGRSHFPDFLNPDVRKWFGSYYERLTSLGFEGFWNDMNEPAMFYSEQSLKDAFKKLKSYQGKNLDIQSFFEFKEISASTFNRADDYERFFNKAQMKDGSFKVLNHSEVHNIFGANMTRAAGEGLKNISPNKRMLIYSRASCVGSHRYGGIWTGDNFSWWSNIKQELQMLPSLNMCGFLYTGADIGGFSCDTSRDLVLRWTAFGVFTPLMRNHSAASTREQEFYQFNHTEDFQSVMNLRYALLPFLYSEFVKSAVSSKMFFKPLSFDFPKDERAIHVEDELLLGEYILLAPVYEQNAIGRFVYLPEDMTQVTWQNNKASQTEISKGDHFVEVPLNAVVFFVRKNRCVPLCKPALNTRDLDTKSFTLVGNGKSYELYEDDGITYDINLEKNTRTIS